MLSIRTIDNAEIQSDSNSPLIFAQANRRENSVKKFKIINGNQIEFFTDVLDVKTIPKDERIEIDNHPYCVVETETKSIIFQNIGSSAKFLVLNDDGFFTKTEFADLSAGDDEILFYDELTEDYIIEEVKSTYLLSSIDAINIHSLSNYVLLSHDSGIIINGFMVI